MSARTRTTDIIRSISSFVTILFLSTLKNDLFDCLDAHGDFQIGTRTAQVCFQVLYDNASVSNLNVLSQEKTKYTYARRQTQECESFVYILDGILHVEHM